jgi:hypothetical protein
MNLHQGDIWTRRERTGRTALWLSERLVLNYFSSDTTEEYLRKKARYKFRESVATHRRKQAIMPDTGASWRYAKQDGQFYYDYDRLPDERRELLPGKAELEAMYKKAMAESRQSDLETRFKEALKSKYDLYLSMYAHYSERHMRKLAKAAAVLVEAVIVIRERSLDVNKNRFFKDAARAVKSIDVQYLPTHYRRLKEKVVAVYEGQELTEVLDLPRAGNTNALRHGDQEMISWLYQLRVAPQNYSDAHIIRKVQRLALMGGKVTPSRSWLQAELSSRKGKWLTQERYGSGRLRNVMEPYTPIQNAVYAGDCWQVDGTRVNFIAHKGKDGKEQFLYIIAVVDVHSGDVMGYHFDTKEDRYGYVHALKMAANRAGYLPWELVVDRFPGHNTDEWETMTKRLEALGTKVNVTSKKTGKAKVERFFSTLQSVFMQESPYYYGEGVQSRRAAAHRSPEYLKSISKEARRDGWDFDASWKEAVRILEMYRTTKYSDYSRRFASVDVSPAQMHDQSDKPHVVKVEPWDFVELFGMERQLQIRRGGLIRTEVQKVPYVYYIPEEHYHIIRDYKTVSVCYDLDDLSKVWLFEPTTDVNRQFLGIAYEQRAAQIYGPEADFKELGKAQARQARIEELRQQELEELVEVGSEVELLLGPHTEKDAYGHAETAWLEERMNEWKDTGKPRILNSETPEELPDDDPDLDIDIRDSY